jgi:hypothetical protein
MPEAVFYWAAIGITLGILNIWLQKLSLNQVGKISDKKLLREFSLFSILRVASAIIVLFFGFKVGFSTGLSCLAGFILIRWLGLARFLLNKRKERR